MRAQEADSIYADFYHMESVEWAQEAAYRNNVFHHTARTIRAQEAADSVTMIHHHRLGAVGGLQLQRYIVS